MSVQLTPVYSADQVALIKKTVAQNATDDELKMFLYLAKEYGLDPFKKEIWFIKYGNETPLIMTSRDGYLKFALSDPEFDGIRSGVIYEGDEFTMEGFELPQHKSGANFLHKDKIIGAWAAAFHKNRKPVVTVVSFEEYYKKPKEGKTNTWVSNPGAMITKVAEAFVLKRQFGISGLVTREEMDSEDNYELPPVIHQEQPPLACSACGTSISKKVFDYSMRKHSAPYCMPCQEALKAEQ